MRYTDTFFTFPVRIYDRFSVIRSIKDEENTETPLEGDWIEGYHKMKDYTKITDIMDFYDSEKGVEGVKKEGFTETLVITDQESFVCTLPRKEFEELLDDFVDRLEKELGQIF